MVVTLLALVGLCVVSYAVSKGLIKVWETYKMGEDAQEVYWYEKR